MADHGHECKRKWRNQSEKKRRDTFNKLIVELCSLVIKGERRLDKSNVLRQTILYLRNNALPSTGGLSAVHSGSVSVSEQVQLMLNANHLSVLVLGANALCMYANLNLHQLVHETPGSLHCCALQRIFTDASCEQIQRILSNEMLRAAAPGHKQTTRAVVHSSIVQLKSDQSTGSSSGCVSMQLTAYFERVQFDAASMRASAAVSPCTGLMFDADGHMSCLVCVLSAVQGLHALQGVSHNTVLRPLLTEHNQRTMHLLLHMDGTVIGTCQQAVAMLGYTSQQVVGLSLYDLCATEYIQVLQQEHTALSAGAVSASCPVALCSKAGSLVHVQLYLTKQNTQTQGTQHLLLRAVTLPATGINNNNTAPTTNIEVEPCVSESVASPCGSVSSSCSGAAVPKRSANVWITHSPLTPTNNASAVPPASPAPAPAMSVSVNVLNANERLVLNQLQQRAAMLQQQVLAQTNELHYLQLLAQVTLKAQPTTTTSTITHAPNNHVEKSD